MANTLEEILSNPIHFIKRLKIISKSGEVISFNLNDVQLQIIEALESGDNIVIAKPRQIGVTTVIAAYFFWKTLTSDSILNTISILHKQDSAQEVFKKYSFFWSSLPKALRKPLEKKTTSSLAFKGGSQIWATTARGDGGLRSYTLSLAHISELCFYNDPDELLSTVISALNGNQIIIESTAKGFGDPMWSLIDRISKAELPGNWRLIFSPWFDHKEYSLEVDSFTPTLEEIELAKTYSLNSAQLAWRRSKISEIGLSSFKTEYPASLEDIFAQKVGAYYSEDDLSKIKTVPFDPRDNIKIFENYNKSSRYVIGVDPASGTGGDPSVIVILNVDTENPALIFRSSHISPVALAAKILHYSTEYNAVKVLIESNNWGLPVIQEVIRLGGTNLWKSPEGSDWVTTVKSKVTLHSDLKEAIRVGRISTLDSITMAQLRELTIPPLGAAPESIRGPTGHSDHVMALGLAWQAAKGLPKRKSYIDSFLESQKVAQIRSLSKSPELNLRRG